MKATRAAEYAEIAAQATAAWRAKGVEGRQTLRRLRAQMRRVERRDFFRPPEREEARRTLRALAQAETTDDEQVPT